MSHLGACPIAIGTQQGAAARTEPTLDFTSGASGALVVGPVAVFAEAGPSFFRLGDTSRAGLAALAGVGTAFRG